jgi:RimJ/RimL family protein N-acetyltransferase
LGANFLFIDTEIDERWFDAYLARWDRAVRLAICEHTTDRLVGVAYLTDIHRINRSAELGIMIGERDVWAQGVGTAATDVLLAHGFNDLNLHRIYLTVLAENDRAIRLYEKLSFQAEGRQREAVFKDGRYRDLVMMALLRSEYSATNRFGDNHVSRRSTIETNRDWRVHWEGVSERSTRDDLLRQVERTIGG